MLFALFLEYSTLGTFWVVIILYYINFKNPSFFLKKRNFFIIFIFRFNKTYPNPGISNFLSNVLSTLVTIETINKYIAPTTKKTKVYSK